MKVSRSKKEYMRVNEKEAGVTMKQEGEEGPKVDKRWKRVKNPTSPGLVELTCLQDIRGYI